MFERIWDQTNCKANLESVRFHHLLLPTSTPAMVLHCYMLPPSLRLHCFNFPLPPSPLLQCFGHWYLSSPPLSTCTITIMQHLVVAEISKTTTMTQQLSPMFSQLIKLDSQDVIYVICNPLTFLSRYCSKGYNLV